MAHKAQQDFLISIKSKFPEKFTGISVLDIGSLDINGNNRYLFTDYLYTGVDLGEGPNVDIISKGHEFDSEPYDVVISTECAEHDQHWKETIENAIRLTKPGGLFLFTCASTGRPEHGTSKSLDWASPYSHLQFNDYYKNLTIEDIKPLIEGKFEPYELIYNQEAYDLYFYGIKR